MFRFLLITLSAIGCLAISPVSLPAQSPAQDDAVSVHVRPKTIERGQLAELEISAPAGRQIPIPVAPQGLRLIAAGETLTTQIVDGLRRGRIGRTYRIVAEELGHFEIIAGSKKAELDVVDRLAAGSPQTAAHDDDDGGVRLVVRPERSTAYVGQRVPVQIELLIPRGRRISFQSLPAASGSAFTLEDPGNKPNQDHVVIDERPYERFTWRSAVVPLRAGSQPLDLAIKLEVSVPVQRAARQGPRSLFDDLDDPNSPFGASAFRSLLEDDPVFQQMFGSFVQKDVTVVPVPAVVLDVKESPADGPADDGGAVGHWRMTTSVDRRSATEGDPLSLRIEITGDGDLGRLAAPAFPPSSEWKAYRAKVVETTAAKGTEQGRKVFELPIVSRRGGDFDIPALSMSTLDPDLGTYTTVSSSPIPVHIDPAPPGRRADPAVAEESGDRDAGPAAELRHVQESEARVGRVTMPWTVIALAGLALLLVPLGLMMGWLRRTGRTDIRHAKSALRKSLQDAERASAGRDTDAFLAACAAAVAQILGRDRSEVLTPADLDRLGLGADQDLRQVCSAVNDVPFSGRRLSPDEMKRCLEALRSAASKERA